MGCKPGTREDRLRRDFHVAYGGRALLRWEIDLLFMCEGDSDDLRLWAGVLEDAIKILHRGAPQRDVHEVMAWLADECPEVRGFGWVCAVLDLTPATVRRDVFVEVFEPLAPGFVG